LGAAALAEPAAAFEEIASRAPFAHVAIETSAGPHVTPVLFTVTAGRLWFVVGRETLKARALAKHPQAGVLLRAGRRSAVLHGEVRLLDPQKPASWRRAGREFASAPLAARSFSLRNFGELLGLALDAPKRPTESLPSNLMLAGLDPAAVAVVGRTRVASSEGSWPKPRRRRGARPSASRRGSTSLELLPREVAGLASRDCPAALGLMTSDGPVALPARWRADSSRADASAELVERVGAGDGGPGCLSIDATEGRRPTAKRGVMLRGTAAIRTRGSIASVSLAVERATYWFGFETGTEPVDA
jgi:hypothetical protein